MRILLLLQVVLPLANLAVLFANDGADSREALKLRLLGGGLRVSIAQPGSPVVVVRFQNREPQTDRPNIRFNDRHVDLLTSFPQLASLSLSNTDVTDDGLKTLKELKLLSLLSVEDLEITDAGLRHIAQITTLTALNLGGTKVTDEGIKELLRMTLLAKLVLHDTSITNEGIKDLTELKTLRFLDVRKTRVTSDGIKRLRESLPNVMTVDSDNRVLEFGNIPLNRNVIHDISH